jgi:long-chain acyl-CoA synthetase
LCGGATIVHQRTLRPEHVRWTMQSQRITHMAVVPLLLEAFERSIDEKLDERPPVVRGLFEALSAFNDALTARKPSHAVSKKLLAPVHEGFGGELRLLFCGGAFVDRARAERFYRLGIPVVIGYGLTEACTVVTVHDLRPFRADSVGKPLPGVEVRIAEPDAEGVGEVLVRGRTVMQGYLHDPELTAETIRDGWLHTGDLGWRDASGHLHLCGRAKNMIVTAGGKNVYPEDVESAFDGVPCEELTVVASNYVWREERPDQGELLLVVRPKKDSDREALARALRERNRSLTDYKRIAAWTIWEREMPRTASMKLKREALAEELRAALRSEELAPL